MNRPIVQRADVLTALAPFGISLEQYPVISLGLQGALSSDATNRIGGFDDALVVLTADHCEAFTGNTDPSTEIAGRANLVLSSTQLRDGTIVGPHWFKPGLHHPGTPKEYAAFVQDGAIIVRRWQTETVLAGVTDPVRGLCLGDGLWQGEFAIHQHDAMGVNTTGSEGCQTVIKTEWPAYHTLLLDELTKRRLQRFPYLLVDSVRATRGAT